MITDDQILDCPMIPEENGARASTVREFLGTLLWVLWSAGDGFSSKRPFGDSDWQYDVYIALSKQGLITGLVLDEDGYIDSFDYAAEQKADKLILRAIKKLGGDSISNV